MDWREDTEPPDGLSGGEGRALIGEEGKEADRTWGGELIILTVVKLLLAGKLS